MFRIFVISVLLFGFIFSDTKTVNLQLHWKHQFQFAGYYMAKEKGFYKKYGLDVNILEHKANIDVINEVRTKDFTYAIARANVLIETIKNKDLLLISSIFKSSPLIFLAKKSSNITKIEHLKNKKIMVLNDDIQNTSLQAMMLSQGVSFDDIIKVNHTYSVKDLIDDNVDLITAYESNEPYFLEQEDIEFITFKPSDYGYNFYDNILFTSKKEIEADSQRAHWFKVASIEGWKYAFENIEETVNLIYSKYNSQNKSKDSLLYEAKKLKELVDLKSYKFGEIDINKLEKMYDVYHILGMLKEPFFSKDIIFEKERFTKKQRKYLKTKKDIKVCIDPNWMPYEKNDNGKHIGISSGYINYFEQVLDKKFNLVQTTSWLETLNFLKDKKCDLITLAMRTKEREKIYNFTESYISDPLVLTTHVNEIFIDNISTVTKPIAITKAYAFKEQLEKKYNNLKFVEVDNIVQGLEKVQNGEVFAYLDSLATSAYHIQFNHMTQLKISLKLEESLGLSLAVRKDEPLLRDVLDELIKDFTFEQKQKIFNEWVSVKIEENSINKKILFSSILIVGIVLCILVFFMRINKKLNIQMERRIKTEKKLKSYIKIVDENVITSRTNLNGVIIYASEAFCKISGYSKNELIGQKHSIVKHEDMPKEFFENLWKTLKKNKKWEGEIKNRSKDGKVYWVKTVISPIFNNKGKKIAYVSTREDITLKKEFERSAITDDLTSLYNRRYFNEMFSRIINSAKRYDEYLCFVILDIDYFKQYNDTYGHHAGDETLKKVAKVIKDSLHRPDDYCFRLGGEEFGLLLKTNKKQDTLFYIDIIRQNIENLEIKHEKNNASTYVTASFGVYCEKVHSISESEIYKKADEMLYKSKEEGRNKISASS